MLGAPCSAIDRHVSIEKFSDRSVMPWAPLRPKVRLMQTCPGGQSGAATGRASSFNEILCWIVPFLEIV